MFENKAENQPYTEEPGEVPVEVGMCMTCFKMLWETDHFFYDHDQETGADINLICGGCHKEVARRLKALRIDSKGRT